MSAVFTYVCSSCLANDERLGGIDDHTAKCVRCGGLMLRLADTEDVLNRFLLPKGESK